MALIDQSPDYDYTVNFEIPQEVEIRKWTVIPNIEITITPVDVPVYELNVRWVCDEIMDLTIQQPKPMTADDIIYAPIERCED